MSRPGRKQLRRNQVFSRPDSGKRIEPVGQGFAEYNDVRRNAQVFDGPEFSRTVEAHLDFIVNQKDLALVECLLEASKVFPGRNDISTRPLNRFDIKSREFRLLSFGIPVGVILRLEAFFELLLAIEAAGLTLQSIDAAEAVRVENEVRAIGEVSVSATVTIA